MSLSYAGRTTKYHIRVFLNSLCELSKEYLLFDTMENAIKQLQDIHDDYAKNYSRELKRLKTMENKLKTYKDKISEYKHIYPEYFI